MKKILLFSLLLVTIFSAVAQIEEEEIIPVYDLGDQTFGFNAGGIIPLFFDFFLLDEPLNQRLVSAAVFYPFPVGGSASLEWNSYLNNNLTLGFELGAMFALTENNTHSMIPLTAALNYMLDFHPFYLPLSFEAGLVINRIDIYTYLGPILKPGVGLFFRNSTQWDFGINLKYWWVPELYFGDDPPKEQSSFGNFLEISFSALFHI